MKLYSIAVFAFVEVVISTIVQGNTYSLQNNAVAGDELIEFFKVNFDIQRGSSRYDIAPHRKAEFVKRDAFTMEITNEQTFYLAQLKIGSNDDEVDVLVDTGSADLWVMSHDVDCYSSSSSSSKRDLGHEIHAGSIKVAPNRKAELKPSKSTNPDNKGLGDSILSAFGISGTDSPFGPEGGLSASSAQASGTNTCTSYGSFNTGGSDTFKTNSSVPDFAIEYADGSSASGIWGTDSVQIHNVTVKSLSLAVANKTSSNIGVLGIGLPGLEVTYSQGTSEYQYENLPIKLRNQGIIKKNAYSLYLGDSNSKTGTILFGAVDNAKYLGTLQTVPIVNSLKSQGFKNPIRLEINLDNLVITLGSKNVTVTDTGFLALLDTGSTLSYFPEDFLEALAETLLLSYSSLVGAYLIDCDNSDSKATLDFDFSGIKISAPLSDFVLQATQLTCVLGILAQGSDSNYVLLGDNFLRSAYVVYDLEDYTISLAQVKHTDKEDIEIITSSIPHAEAVSTAATEAFTGGSVSSATGHADTSGSDRALPFSALYAILGLVFM